MAEGQIVKMEVDHTQAVATAIDKAKNTAASNINLAIDELMVLEKQTRLDSDAISTGKLLEAMIEIIGDAKKWPWMNEHLVFMTKKRSQLKQAVTKMVQKAMTYLDLVPDKKTKLSLIDTLRSVTEGKIYVELERARLTKQLSDIREMDGDIEGACSVLLELQVETYGSMEKKEKVEFLLEQIRLCMLRKDYIRVQIQGDKINIKFFEGEDTDDLKLKYYNLMIEVDYHNNNYINVCKHFYEIYSTKKVQDNENERFRALKNMVANLLLSPYDNEQSDLINRRVTIRDLEKFPDFLDMMKSFIKNELINWKDFCGKYEKLVCSEVETFKGHPKRWEDLKSRVIEHNIRIIALYYNRITIKRMSQLLELSEELTEEYLSDLVIKKTVTAKIDRLLFIVNFTEKKAPIDILNDWSHNVNQLMGLINQTSHLINKERVVHAI
ncbi:26S proteasome non-ATPase regulatory subunit 12 [Cichlidogyrus casuarinus]|uniref:26S proteasome non-ATPase regulatory subunit 12 n=1 Tax=Cichlidogyrus casuarinus TaxID=1844966 RepID=A0ABD2QNT3_9PLAT